MILTMLRHAKPIQTELNHSTWEIHPEDCSGVMLPCKNYDHYLCSTLRRSIMTGEAVFPEAEFVSSELLDEINKPEEPQEEFRARVERAIKELIWPRHQGNIFVASHNRWMLTAYYVLNGRPYGGTLHYLDQLNFKYDTRIHRI